MRLQADGAPVPVARERSELPTPVDTARTHLSQRPECRHVVGDRAVLRMHMSDPRDGDVPVALRIRDLASDECVGGIPDDAQRGMIHGCEESRGLGPGRDIARVLVLDAEDERSLTGAIGQLAQR